MNNYQLDENPSQELVAKMQKYMNQTEGWSIIKGAYSCFEGLDYWKSIMLIDPEDGEPIANISISMTNSLDQSSEGRLFYIGGFYVRPEYRAKGIGRELFALTMAKAKGANVALNGAIHLTEMYIKKGFIHCRQFKQAFAQIRTQNLQLKKAFEENSFLIKRDKEVLFEEIAEYERGISDRNRTKYLQLWLDEPHGASKVAIEKTTGKIVGLISIHPMEIPCLFVGPLYADSTEIARQLLNSLLEEVDLTGYDHINFKFPETAVDLKGLLEEITGEEVKTQINGLCQFTNRIIPCDIQRVYAFFETGHSLV